MSKLQRTLMRILANPLRHIRFCGPLLDACQHPCDKAARASAQCGASKRHSNTSETLVSMTQPSPNRRATSSTATTFAGRGDRPSCFVWTNFSCPALEVFYLSDCPGDRYINQFDEPEFV